MLGAAFSNAKKNDQDSSGSGFSTKMERLPKVKTFPGSKVKLEIVPYFKDSKWFAFPYRSLFVDFQRADGSVYTTVLRLTYNDEEDYSNQDPLDKKLDELVTKIVDFNKAYTNATGNKGDIVKLQSKSAFPSRPRVTYATALMIMDNQQKGSKDIYPRTDATTGLPKFFLWDMPQSVYLKIINTLRSDDYQLDPDGNEWTYPTKFITDTKTYPIQIDYDENDKRYGMTVREGLVAPALPENYLEKDAAGEYKYLDDLSEYAKPTAVTSPDFVKSVVIPQLTQRLEYAINEAKGAVPTGIDLSAPQKQANPLDAMQQNMTNPMPKQAPQTSTTTQAPIQNDGTPIDVTDDKNDLASLESTFEESQATKDSVAEDKKDIKNQIEDLLKGINE